MRSSADGGRVAVAYSRSMTSATHREVIRLFPGLDDHTVTEVLATRATLGDLEAAAALLADEDEGTIEARRRAGDRISRVVGILMASEIAPADDRD